MIAQISVYLQAVDLLREGARRPSDFCLQAGPVSGEEVSCRTGVASDPAVVRGCAQGRGIKAFAVVGVEFELDLDVLLVGPRGGVLVFAGPAPRPRRGGSRSARVPGRNKPARSRRSVPWTPSPGFIGPGGRGPGRARRRRRSAAGSASSSGGPTAPRRGPGRRARARRRTQHSSRTCQHWPALAPTPNR